MMLTACEAESRGLGCARGIVLVAPLSLALWALIGAAFVLL